MVAILTRLFGAENLETAEDVVQDTLIQALEVWKLKGIPDNPAGWIFQAARNKAVDHLRRQRHSVRFDFGDERAVLRSEYTLEAAVDGAFKRESIEDDMLRMMYACCHPGISAEGQITLILKTLCGFSTAEIAAAFLTGEDTVSKRLYRAKEFFRKEKVPVEIPPPDELKPRTGAVLDSIYLLFNEGYSSSLENETIRRDLMGEAMHLCKLLAENPLTHDARAWALLALMCFHAARSDSRLGDEGEIILLPDQDRSRWDRRLIEEGNACMARAAGGEGLSTYHLEAAIAYRHCAAPTFAEVDWTRILEYYGWLAKLAPNPVVDLNRCAALLQAEGPEAARAELDSLGGAARFGGMALYHGLRGEVLARTGDRPGARAAFEEAARLARNRAERRLLTEKAAAQGA